MINLFLGVALVAAPFFVKSGAQTTTVFSQEYFLVITAMLGAFLFGIKTNKRIKLAGIILFALAFTTHNPAGMFQYYQLMHSIAGIAFIAVIYGQRKWIDRDLIKKCLAAVCLLESGWIFFQYFGINLHKEWFLFLNPNNQISLLTNNPYFGSLGNINHSGALIACLIPFLSWRLWIVPALALYLGGSSLPVICAIVGVVAFWSYQNRNYLYLKLSGVVLFILAVLLYLGVFAGTYLADTTRIQAWTLFLKITGIQFWGKGFGYISEIFSRNIINGEKFYQLHNEWLELYAIAGLLGVVAGLFLIVPVFKNKGNPEINACLIALLVNSLGNFTFHIAPLFMVFGTCYAFQISKE